jgi:uncharacterized protein (UPF0335 family)
MDEPSAGGGYTTISTVSSYELAQVMDDKITALEEHLEQMNEKVTSEIEDIASKGYTFKKLKNSLGSPGKNFDWHHIVEQCQIKKSGFAPKVIQTADNVIAISKEVHRQISGYYSSIQEDFSEGMRVRDWLAGKSLEFQTEFGKTVIKLFAGED